MMMMLCRMALNVIIIICQELKRCRSKVDYHEASANPSSLANATVDLYLIERNNLLLTLVNYGGSKAWKWCQDNAKENSFLKGNNSTDFKCLYDVATGNQCLCTTAIGLVEISSATSIAIIH